MKITPVRAGMVLPLIFSLSIVQAENSLILNGENCGVTQSMVVSKDQNGVDYNIEIVGADGCSVGGASGGVSIPNDVSTLTVDGGNSASLDVITGVRAEMPVSIVIVSKPDDSLGTTVKDDSAGRITFRADSTSQIIDNQVITYRLTANDGSESALVTVYLTINPGGVGDSSKCVEGSNLVCKGAHDKLVYGGNIQNVFMNKNAIHVWEFRYHNNSGSGAETILNLDPSVVALSHLEIDFTINSNPGNMDVGVDGQNTCIRRSNVIGVSNHAKTSYCQLVEGQTYFLNMQNLGRKGADGVVRATQGYYTIGR